MRRTPGKPRRIKYPYLTRKRRKKVLIFEIKSADSTEWARWYLGMSAGDEMRAQKITFILCIELSLKTSLEPRAAWRAPRCVSWDFQTLIFLCGLNLSVKLPTCPKREVRPGRCGSADSPGERRAIIYKRMDECVAQLSEERQKVKKRRRKWDGGKRNGKRKKKKKLLHG